MHNAALRALSLNYVYAAFRVAPAALPQALAGMRALGMVGLNVTVPHKQAVMAHLDEISAEAQSIGAVNTITNRDGQLVGYNTDAFGIVQSLKADGGLDPLPPKVALLGAGGAARAVLYALLARDEVEEVLLLNRTVEKAAALAGDLDSAGKVRVGSLTETEPIGDAGLLINATALGMHPRDDVSPLADPSCLHERMLVADIVYNPLETVLMRQAAAAGASAINGLGMLAWQGARSFEIWTGVEPPVEAMIAAALEHFPD
jgi:shikimate dehydrogenase